MTRFPQIRSSTGYIGTGIEIAVNIKAMPVEAGQAWHPAARGVRVTMSVLSKETLGMATSYTMFRLFGGSDFDRIDAAVLFQILVEVQFDLPLRLFESLHLHVGE